MPSFFFNDTATTEIYTLSLHDALPIFHGPDRRSHRHRQRRLGLSRSQGGILQRKAYARYGVGAVGIGGPRRRHRTARMLFAGEFRLDRKSTRLNSSHQIISYAVFFF